MDGEPRTATSTFTQLRALMCGLQRTPRVLSGRACCSRRHAEEAPKDPLPRPSLQKFLLMMWGLMSSDVGLDILGTGIFRRFNGLSPGSYRPMHTHFRRPGGTLRVLTSGNNSKCPSPCLDQGWNLPTLRTLGGLAMGFCSLRARELLRGVCDLDRP